MKLQLASLGISLTLLLGAASPTLAGDEEDDRRPERAERGQRLEKSTKDREAQEQLPTGRDRPLRSGTLGGNSPPSIVPPDLFAASFDEALDVPSPLFRNGESIFFAFDQVVGIGPGALDSVTPNGGMFYYEGYGNTAVGVQALTDLTIGNYNTAVGYLALWNSVEGSDNTAVGADALGSTEGASANTAVGSKALASSTSGSGNAVLGAGAMSSSTSGNSNVAVGADSLRDNTVGDDNLAVGSLALAGNTDGDANVAVGNLALRNNEGDDNVAVGFGSLHSNTTGFRNIAVGYYSLANNTSGDDNISIGRFAGSANISGDYNIFIGSAGDAGDGTNDTNETIRIGGVQDRTFVAGILNSGLTGAVHAVYVDPSGQLGQNTSSRRYKREIQDMAERSSALLDLRPVTFRYEEETEEPELEAPLRYGLIAEEVAEVLPELVSLDDRGRPNAVLYHLLVPMLLNELQRQQQVSEMQAVELKRLQHQMQRLEAQSQSEGR